jgi:glycosyltransferase involved in cell wall biosynthesis
VSDGTVSVAMATYNGAPHLEQQLESIVSQTLPPAELVVHDDGSTDETVDLLTAFASDSPFPVQVRVSEAGGGFADAFLHAATLCTGEFVAFCDQDDVWLPEKLATVVAALRAPDVVLAVHLCSVVDDGLRPVGRTFPRIGPGVCPPLSTDPWLPVPGMAMAFERSLIEGLDLHRRPPSHDLPGRPVRHDEWIYGLARAAGSVAFLPQPLALYRQHAKNVMGAPTQSRAAAALATGWSYYSARRDQANAWSLAFSELAEREQDAARRERLRRASASYRSLAERLESRLQVYEPRQSTWLRLRRIAQLASAGGYRSRRRGGFGVRAVVRDAAMVALRRVG